MNYQIVNLVYIQLDKHDHTMTKAKENSSMIGNKCGYTYK